MKYRIHPGVVLTEVCDEFMLLATAEARGIAAYAMGLNRTQAYFWSLLEQGLDSEEITAQAAEAYHISKEQVSPVLGNFLDAMERLHYLQREGETV